MLVELLAGSRISTSRLKLLVELLAGSRISTSRLKLLVELLAGSRSSCLISSRSSCVAD